MWAVGLPVPPGLTSIHSLEPGGAQPGLLLPLLLHQVSCMAVAAVRCTMWL